MLSTVSNITGLVRVPEADTLGRIDDNGNREMSLKELGLDAWVKFHTPVEMKGIGLHMIEAAMAVSGLKNDAAGKKLRDLKEKEPDKYAKVIAGGCMYKFIGKGQRDSRLITLDGVYGLIDYFNCATTQAIKAKFTEICQRFIAGDPAMVQQLFENNQSNSDINVLHRVETGVEQVQPTSVMSLQSERNKRRLVINDEKREHANKKDLITHDKDAKIEVLNVELKVEQTKATIKKDLWIAEINYLKERNALQNPPPQVPVVNPLPSAPLAVQPAITVYDVLLRDKALADLPMEVQKDLAKRAGSLVKAAPFNRIPLPDKIKDQSGLEANQYEEKDALAIGGALYVALGERNAKDKEKKTSNNTSSSQPITNFLVRNNTSSQPVVVGIISMSQMGNDDDWDQQN